MSRSGIESDDRVHLTFKWTRVRYERKRSGIGRGGANAAAQPQQGVQGEGDARGDAAERVDRRSGAALLVECRLAVQSRRLRVDASLLSVALHAGVVL